MDALAFDFSTQNVPSQLKNYLTTNLKQAMMNQMVAEIMTSTGTQSSPIAVESPGIGLYLDMFSDEQQVENFCLVRQIENGGVESKKFVEVYKNDIQTLDEVDLSQGRICGLLNECVQAAFGGDSSINLLYQPSITAMRTVEVDKFTYCVKFNLNLAVKRNIVDKSRFGERNYIIGNAMVKDLVCEVSFTPKFKYSSPQMTYDVNYKVAAGHYNATYSKILYVYSGKVRTKNISGAKDYNLALSEISYSESGSALPNLPQEIAADKILNNLFTSDKTALIVKNLNDAINGFATPETWQIDSIEIKNSGTPDGKWELGQPIPFGLTPELVKRGKTIIDSHVFDVSSDDTSLTSSTTTKTFDIKEVKYNVLNDAGEIESSDNLRKIAVQRDSEIATQDEINRNFTLSTFQEDGDSTYRFLRFNPSGDFATGNGHECGIEYRMEFSGSNLFDLSGYGNKLLVFTKNENYTVPGDDPDTWLWQVEEKPIAHTSFECVEYNATDMDDEIVGWLSDVKSFKFTIDGDQLNSSGTPKTNAQYKIVNDDLAEGEEPEISVGEVQYEVSGYNAIDELPSEEEIINDGDLKAILNSETKPEQWIGKKGQIVVKIQSLNLDENWNPTNCQLQFTNVTSRNVDSLEIYGPYEFLTDGSDYNGAIRVKNRILTSPDTEIVNQLVTADPEPLPIGENVFTLTFMDGEVTYATLSLNANQRVVPPVIEDTETLVFVGWDNQVSNRAKENATYSARWMLNTSPDIMNVTFNANGGMVEIGTSIDSQLTIKVEKGKPSWIMPVPVRDGYSFDGWYESEADAAPVDDDRPINVSTMYFARWTKITYEIEFQVKSKVKEIVLYTKPTHPYLLPLDGVYVYD